MHTTQTYKHKRLTRTKVKNNILKMYNKTTQEDRLDWYGEANEFAQAISQDWQPNQDYNINIACGVLAALSPVKRWEQNKLAARSMVNTGDCGHMIAFKNKARNIIASDGREETILDILNGNKIVAFYHNLRHPKTSNYVTIDRHALSIALGYWVADQDYNGMTAKQFEFFQQCYIWTAEGIGISALSLQSATWERFRKIKTEYKK